MGACRDNFYKMLLLYIHDLCSCPVAPVGKDQTLKCNTYIFIDERLRKVQDWHRNTNAMNSWLRWSWYSWWGRNPWLSSYWAPVRAITQSQPIGWVPWECVLQEEGRRSPGPTWRVPITSGTYCRCQRDIVASDGLPGVIKVIMTGEASVAGTSSGVKFR